MTKRRDDVKHDRFLRLVGKRIAVARHSRGFTQELLAERTRMPTRALQTIEAGRVNMTLRTVARIAEALEVAPDALIAGLAPTPAASSSAR